jgi:thioredoxin 1
MNEFVKKFSDDNFKKEVLDDNSVVFVDFWAPWCGPCQMLGPIIDQLAEELKDKNIKIGKLNVDENPEVSSKYEVRSIPTMIIFKNGKKVETLVGLRDKSFLKSSLEKHL